MRAISGDFLAIDRKTRGSCAIPGCANPTAVEERICDFEDVVIPLSPEQAMFEASRCVQCPDPAPCVQACPAHNDIPSAMWLIEQGKFLEAAQLYRQTSSMPEICGQSLPTGAALSGLLFSQQIHFSSTNRSARSFRG